MTDFYSPVNASSGPARRSRLATSSSVHNLSTTPSTVAAGASPITTRSGRSYGATPKKATFSPYARRVAETRSRVEEEEVNDAKGVGLISMVTGLPGRAFGYLFGSGTSSRSLSASANANEDSVMGSRNLEEEEKNLESSGARLGRGLPERYVMEEQIRRSSTVNNFGSRINPLPHSASLDNFQVPPPPPPPPPPRSSARSAHSTLAIPNSVPPKFLSRTTRAGSPALSSSSTLDHRNRSPSPTRNGLAGSMSAFNLGDQYRAASPSTIFAPTSSATQSNSFGLTSRSPFARSPSITSSPLPRSQSGHSLFPYSSSIPRGASPSRLNDESNLKRSHSQFSDGGGSPGPQSMRNNGQQQRNGVRGVGSSNLATAPAYSFIPAASVRQNSPLNPAFGQQQQREGEMMGGAERARKKQLIWDPESGFVSREELEREKMKEREKTLPKNEAERILEVLEGMGRTPMGEVQRRTIQPIQINVPTPFSPISSLYGQPTTTSAARFGSSSLSQSTSTPISPYARRTKAGVDSTATPRRPGTGLSSVFRAREERRRAAEDVAREEREERERERMEEEERMKEREQRRRVKRQEREREMEMDLEEEQEEEDVPRRKTRSMARATPTSKGSGTPKVSSRVLKMSTRSRGRGKQTEESAEEEVAEEVVKRSTRSKRGASPPPPPPPPSEPVASPSPPATLPAASISTSTGAASSSSLRPGRTHTSRSHVASSRVFSAREEDLPPVSEGELDKIKLPPMVFPTGFSFGETTKQVESVSSQKEQLVTAVIPPPQINIISTPAPPLPAFSFAAPVTTTSSPAVAPADFFSLPPSASASPVPELFATSSSTTATKPPNFFGAPKVVLPPVPAAAFSFAKPITPPVIVAASESAPSNPFAGFGKPISSILAESKSESESNGISTTSIPSLFAPSAPSTTTTAPTFSFGTTPSVAPATTSSPFAFNAPPLAPSTLPAAPASITLADMPELFNDQDEDSGMEDHSAPSTAIAKPSTGFNFGSTAGGMTFGSGSSTPTFGGFGGLASSNGVKDKVGVFGSSSAAPTSLFPAAATSASLFGGFGSASPSPAASPAPGGVFNFSAPAAAVSATPAPFSFGNSTFAAPASSTPASPAPFTFGAPAQPSSSNIFGASSSAAPALARVNSGFGQPSSGGLFSGLNSGATTPTLPFAGFGTAPTPGTTTPAFSFGASSGTPAASPFNFGAPAASSASPAFSFGASSAAPTSSIFGAPAAAPPSPALGGAMFNLGSGGEESTPKGGRRIAPLRKRK